MTPEELNGGALGGPIDLAPPPPAEALLHAVGTMKPVRPRGRLTGFALVLGIGVIAPLGLLLLRPRRADLASLPSAWLLGEAAVWLLAFGGALGAALIPARGDVMPSAGRAARIGIAAIALLALATLLGGAPASGPSHHAAAGAGAMLGACLGCVGVLLPIALVYLVAGVVVLRRVLPMGARRIGIALGAAGGAMGGLALQFHCPIAATDHVLLGHVGGVALAALAGALALPALLERRARS